MHRMLRYVAGFLLLILAACETNSVIVNNVEEREANEIVVFLSSRGIKASKVPMKAGPAAGTESGPQMWSIAVSEGMTTQAMAILNQNGLPRKQGTNLLDLFAKQGFMTTDREETIRYQAGLEQQIANTIRKIDGVIDANVQLAFPSATATAGPPGQTPQQKITAAVYVKHQGVVDDPNSHLVSKIKRLVAGSVNGLDINDVTVISDRSRFTDVTINETLEEAVPPPKEHVSIWSIVISKDSVAKFRVLFFTLIFTNIVLLVLLGWILWKFYPVLKEGGGFKQLLHPIPVKSTEAPPEEKNEV
ncbi:MAG: type III secretion inner membrane ring lipoprotein SctJ [Verrucomicrobia bacterium]|nr:type III secretion inner membrane ring lipoprotein SctJ [Verrucomicrobiota bacterium]